MNNTKTFRLRIISAICLWLVMVSCTASEKQLEPLYGIVLTKGNVRIQVKSNGCTNAASFEMAVKQNQLSIFRVKPDNCRRGNFRVWVDFTEHYRMNRLILINPIKFFDKS